MFEEDLQETKWLFVWFMYRYILNCVTALPGNLQVPANFTEVSQKLVYSKMQECNSTCNFLSRLNMPELHFCPSFTGSIENFHWLQQRPSRKLLLSLVTKLWTITEYWTTMHCQVDSTVGLKMLNITPDHSSITRLTLHWHCAVHLCREASLPSLTAQIFIWSHYLLSKLIFALPITKNTKYYGHILTNSIQRVVE